MTDKVRLPTSLAEREKRFVFSLSVPTTLNPDTWSTAPNTHTLEGIDSSSDALVVMVHEDSRISLATKTPRRDVFIEFARQIEEEIKDTKWDFRSPFGIARATGIPESIVHDYLEKSDYIARYDFPNYTGKPVYAVRDVNWLTKIKRQSGILYAHLLGYHP